MRNKSPKNLKDSWKWLIRIRYRLKLKLKIVRKSSFHRKRSLAISSRHTSIWWASRNNNLKNSSVHLDWWWKQVWRTFRATICRWGRISKCYRACDRARSNSSRCCSSIRWRRSISWRRDSPSWIRNEPAWQPSMKRSSWTPKDPWPRPTGMAPRKPQVDHSPESTFKTSTADWARDLCSHIPSIQLNQTILCKWCKKKGRKKKKQKIKLETILAHIWKS